MGRTFFGFGIFKTNSDGRQGPGHSSLPPIDENPNLAEWLGTRDATSHSTLGLDPSLNIDFVTPSGEHRPGVFVGEEAQPSGDIHAYIASDGATGKKETHRLTFTPDKARTMRQTDNRRILE